MDNFFKNIKDNIMDLVKDSKLGQSINKDEVSKTLEKLDPRNLPTEEITKQISSVTEQSKQVIEDVSNAVSEEAQKLKDIASIVGVAKSVDSVTIVEVAKAGYNLLKESNHSLMNDDKKSDDVEDIDPVWDI